MRLAAASLFYPVLYMGVSWVITLNHWLEARAEGLNGFGRSTHSGSSSSPVRDSPSSGDVADASGSVRDGASLSFTSSLLSDPLRSKLSAIQIWTACRCRRWDSDRGNIQWHARIRRRRSSRDRLAPGRRRPRSPKRTAPRRPRPSREPRGEPGMDVRLSPRNRVSLYAASRYLTSSVKEACRLRIPFLTYFKDPAVAKSNPMLDFDEDFEVNWEPGLTDGPTSARFAVVDFNADTGRLAPPAQWDEPNQQFTTAGKPLTRESTSVFQFHQVSVWAVLQRALDFFENPDGLGRRSPGRSRATA